MLKNKLKYLITNHISLINLTELHIYHLIIVYLQLGKD